jgi:hypothetical protein
MLISSLELVNKRRKRIKITMQSIHPTAARHGASCLVEIEIQVLADIDERVVSGAREGVAAPCRSAWCLSQAAR